MVDCVGRRTRHRRAVVDESILARLRRARPRLSRRALPQARRHRPVHPGRPRPRRPPADPPAAPVLRGQRGPRIRPARALAVPAVDLEEDSRSTRRVARLPRLVLDALHARAGPRVQHAAAGSAGRPDRRIDPRPALGSEVHARRAAAGEVPDLRSARHAPLVVAVRSQGRPGQGLGWISPLRRKPLSSGASRPDGERRVPGVRGGLDAESPGAAVPVEDHRRARSRRVRADRDHPSEASHARYSLSYTSGRSSRTE